MTEDQVCGCIWDGKKCPHCNRNVLYNGELLNRHMPRCHDRSIDGGASGTEQ